MPAKAAEEKDQATKSMPSARAAAIRLSSEFLGDTRLCSLSESGAHSEHGYCRGEEHRGCIEDPSL